MQHLKLLTCLHGSKAPFSELNFSAARGHVGKIYFVERGQSLVSENAVCWGYLKRYQAAKSATKTFRELLIFSELLWKNVLH